MLTKVTIKHKEKIYIHSNEVTDDIAEFMGGYLSGNTDFKLTHIYGQYGDPLLYIPDTGPFFTPSKSDKFEDLISATIETVPEKIISISSKTQEGQTRYSKNVLTILSMMTQNDGKSYIGAGLVCELPGGRKLLLGHVAYKGILKNSNYAIAIAWEWQLENNL